MKKRILLLLAVVLCVSLCACGGSETTQTNQTSDEKITENENTNKAENIDEAKIEFVEPKGGNEGYYKVYIPKEALEECSSIVSLTMDNWSDYFEDYEYTKCIVEENEFGDKKETEVLLTGFGAKEGMIICEIEDVCFKIKADNSDGYFITYYEIQQEDGYIKHCLVDGVHMPINTMTGKLGENVPLDVVGKILVFENLPIDISQIDYSKRQSENLTIELVVGEKIIKGTNALEYVLSEYYHSYGLE